MKVSFNELEDAFISANDEMYFWLDKKTGKVIFCDEEIRQALTGGDEMLDWQKEIAEAARPVLIALGEIEMGEEISQAESERYVEITPLDSSEKWQAMADFAETVNDARLQNELARALRGGKPFRRFKNVLSGYPDFREKWLKYENDWLRKYISDWAEAENVEIDFES